MRIQVESMLYFILFSYSIYDSYFWALFFFMFQFLTYEKSTPPDLLDNIQSGSSTKRWQSAFELSNMLDKSEVANKELFIIKWFFYMINLSMMILELEHI